MTPWDHILHSPREAHLVHFYGKDNLGLARNVSKYLSNGLRAGENGLLVATAAHAELFLSDIAEDLRSRIRLLDAHETLARFMIEGMPDWERFETAIGPQLQSVR